MRGKYRRYPGRDFQQLLEGIAENLALLELLGDSVLIGTCSVTFVDWWLNESERGFYRTVEDAVENVGKNFVVSLTLVWKSGKLTPLVTFTLRRDQRNIIHSHFVNVTRKCSFNFFFRSPYEIRKGFSRMEEHRTCPNGFELSYDYESWILYFDRFLVTEFFCCTWINYFVPSILTILLLRELRARNSVIFQKFVLGNCFLALLRYLNPNLLLSRPLIASEIEGKRRDFTSRLLRPTQPLFPSW